MRINTLELTNFQGIKHAAFDFNGHDVDIYGDNATGKTTIANAWCWLLFDRASTAIAKYSPKTRGIDGELHGLDHSVTANISLDNGQTVTFSKTLKETWKKKRGAAQADFCGHSVDYAINGVPSKEREYSDYIASIANGIDNLMILTIPGYFAEGISWDQRRRVLLEMLGDISDDAVIDSLPELAGLRDYLCGRSVDDVTKIAKAKKTEINKQLNTIPARIDEASRAIPEEVDYKEIESKLLNLPDPIEKKREELAKVKTEAAQAQASYTMAIMLKRSQYADTVKEINDRLETARKTLSAAVNGAEIAGYNIRRLETMRKDLLSEYSKIQAMAWEDSNEICPTCGRPLPEDEIAAAKAEFTANRSQKLTEINERGKKTCSQAVIDAAKDELREQQQLIEQAQNDIVAISAELTRAKESTQVLAWHDTDEGKRYKELIESIEHGPCCEDDQKTQQERIHLQALLAGRKQAEAQRQRIAALKDEERKLAGEYEQMERGLYLCELFSRTKANMLEDGINQRFANVRFRLFVEQINGGLKDDCEVMLPAENGGLVPYSHANRAAQINASIEIISVLGVWLGISAPVIIDNAEAVTHLITSGIGQLIRLIVSEPDKKMRVEQILKED